MRKLLFMNRDPLGPIWVDARLSNGDIPFDDLQPIAGFPCLVDFGHTCEIDAGGFVEILYRRSLYNNQHYLPLLFRLAINPEASETKGSIWPTPFVTSQLK